MGISAATLEQHWSMSGAVKIACLFYHHCNRCSAALSLTIASPGTCAWRVATEVCLQELIAKVFSIFWGVSRQPELLAEKQSQVFNKWQQQQEEKTGETVLWKWDRVTDCRLFLYQECPVLGMILLGKVVQPSSTCWKMGIPNPPKPEPGAAEAN